MIVAMTMKTERCTYLSIKNYFHSRLSLTLFLCV